MELKMDNSPPKLWKVLFLMAGFFNAVAGAAGMGFPALGIKFITGVETSEPGVLFIFFVMSFVVALFGLGYLMVAKNASANRGLISIGTVAKISLFVMAFYGFLNNLSTLEFMLVASSDLLWATLFMRYLWLSKKLQSTL